jgi:hypothetical protein
VQSSQNNKENRLNLFWFSPHAPSVRPESQYRTGAEKKHRKNPTRSLAALKGKPTRAQYSSQANNKTRDFGEKKKKKDEEKKESEGK